MSSDELQWSIEVPHSSRVDRGNIRRAGNPLASAQLAYDGCYTLYEALRRGKELNPMGPCLGFRAVSSSGYATPFVYSSYTEIVSRVDAFAAGLERLGLTSKNDDGMTLIGLYLKNCMEWVIAEHAIYCLSGITVPLYDTLGPTTVEFVMNQTDTPVVVCTRAELSALCQAKQSGNCPRFKYVILVDGVIPSATKIAQEAGLTLLSFAKVEAMGAQIVETQGHKHSPPCGKDLATFCYTSGTTGNPKGALITHENLMSTCAGAVGLGLSQQTTDRHLSYLPLPHIFERVVIAGVLTGGASVGFFRGDPKLLVEDIQALRPTVMPVAPRVLNKIYDKIFAGINAVGGVKKKIFYAGLKAKTEGLQHGHMKHGLYDRLLFNKIKAALGMDHLRIMISGSAPLSAPVMTFFRCLLGIPVVEGYGQTEGSAAATIGHPDDIATAGHVGGPTECCEVVLVDVPEMGYFHTDTMHRGDQGCKGRGEIWVRGPNVFKGYYKDEEKTKETIDEEGWLRSGDIGLWTLGGALQIIDRKKNIFKLAQGEYVAAEKIENALMQSSLIGQIFVYGDSYQSYLVAVIIPDEEVIPTTWAKNKEESEQMASGTLSKASLQELCRNSKLLKEDIMTDIRNLSKSSGLKGFETIKSIHLDHEPLSVENGMLTPTFKLKRKQIQDKYQSMIDEMYKNSPFPASKL